MTTGLLAKRSVITISHEWEKPTLKTELGINGNNSEFAAHCLVNGTIVTINCKWENLAKFEESKFSKIVNLMIKLKIIF